MSSDALEALRACLFSCAQEAGLSFEPSRLRVGRASHFSLCARQEEAAQVLSECFAAQRGTVSRCESSGPFVNGFVSEDFLTGQLRRFVRPGVLSGFAFPPDAEEEALFSFPLYERAQLCSFTRLGGELLCPPGEEARALLWALLTAAAFPDPLARQRLCIQKASAFLRRQPRRQLPACFGLTAAALTALCSPV